MIDRLVYSDEIMDFDQCKSSAACMEQVCPYVHLQWMLGTVIEGISLLIILLVTYMSV